MRLNISDRGPDPVDPADRAAPPVVLVHGLFGRGRNMSFFQRRLAVHRRVLTVDLRSHGDSPHGPMSYRDMAADLADSLQALDALPAVLCGHSMGGKVCMALALSRPELVSRLLVADMPPAATGHGNAALAAKLLALPLPATLNRAGADRLLTAVSPSPEVRGLLTQNLRLGDDPGWTIGLQDIVDSMPAIEGWPDAMLELRYDGPTLFVTGQTSFYVQPEHYPVMRALFPAHTLEVVEEAGHWLHAEKPARFLELLGSFAGVPLLP